LAGFSAYPRSLDYAKFVEIGNEVDALLVADMAHMAGLIAGGAADNPLDYGFHVMTMTTHKTLRGPRGGMILSKGIISNPLKAPDKTIANIPTLIDRAVFPGTQGGPHMNTIAAKAVCLYEAMQPEFKVYAQQVVDNAKVLAEELKKRGFNLVTGGTDNNIILIDVYKSFGIDGKIAQEALEKAGITVNANAVPDDLLPPFRPSGIRLGVAAMTTRGFKVMDMVRIADLIRSVISK
jgi:glycine hydroxymethyltransferase